MSDKLGSWDEFKKAADEQRRSWERHAGQPLVWFSTRDYARWYFSHLPVVLNWIDIGALETNDEGLLVFTEEFEAKIMAMGL